MNMSVLTSPGTSRNLGWCLWPPACRHQAWDGVFRVSQHGAVLKNARFAFLFICTGDTDITGIYQ